MYKKLPNLVLGFHGCNYSTYENVVMKGQQLKRSSNSYDWLGNGIYFWEQNYQRAFEWAVNRYGVENAAVIGAVIDLGYCLNLTDSTSAEVLRKGYEILKIRCETVGNKLPRNRPSKKTKDILHRCRRIWITQYRNLSLLRLYEDENCRFPLIRRITSPIPNNKKNTIGNEPCIKVEIITFVVVSFSFLSYGRINKKDCCVNCDLILQEENRRGSSGSFFIS